MKTLIGDLSKELKVIEYCYVDVKTNQIDKEFYNDVVPYSKKIDRLCEQLSDYKSEISHLPYMNEHKFKLLISNLKDLSVECHYAKTSRKLFTEKLKAVQYDLNYIKRCEKTDV
ncbi:YppE family protein [Staphylococcus sp. SQ8-PEA]|uniref:YppE family protein n=1 Tax=Staphylococcus marylandisciuri TaxID=2981529 RepID=A0ABT2QNE7_9STAP|nr:YppE family protein [Staphylococcus marylandisciuri]MCU5745502.1 YppE family protein [Staphylococcus marylandisciuri]